MEVCINCNYSHTVNYQDCLAFIQTASTLVINKPKKSSTDQLTSFPNLTLQPVPPTYSSSTSLLPTQHLSYVTKNEPAINTNRIIALLSELFTAISSTDDPKTIISTTQSQLIHNLAFCFQPIMNNITLIYWNSNGITNKLYELKALDFKLNIDIILLSKIRLKPTSKFHILNYITYRPTSRQRLPGSRWHCPTGLSSYRSSPRTSSHRSSTYIYTY